jgi:hypothetical protein
VAGVGGAQQPPVIGLLVTGSAGTNAEYVGAFRGGLIEMGFVEGRNVFIEYRYADNDIPHLGELAAELVRRHVAVIATLAAPRRCVRAGRQRVDTDRVRNRWRPGSSRPGDKSIFSRRMCIN